MLWGLGGGGAFLGGLRGNDGHALTPAWGSGRRKDCAAQCQWRIGRCDMGPMGRRRPSEGRHGGAKWGWHPLAGPALGFW